MPIISGGGGGLPAGWTAHRVDVSSGSNTAFLSDFPGLFIAGANAFVEVDNDANASILIVQNTSVGEILIGTAVSSAPPDSDLVAGQLALWFDRTNGASKFMLKGKTADGTVVSASVAMA